MKSKKAVEGVWWTVVVLATLLIFFLLYSNAWANLFRKSASSVNQLIGSTDDYDGDDVINLDDKCPCEKGDAENKGCLINYKITDTGLGSEDKSCLEQKK